MYILISFWISSMTCWLFRRELFSPHMFVFLIVFSCSWHLILLHCDQKRCLKLFQNTPLTPTDRSTKQKISKETQTLNDTMDQLDLIDIYRTFHPKTMNFTFFSSAHTTFSRIDHTLGHKSSLGKFFPHLLTPFVCKAAILNDGAWRSSLLLISIHLLSPPCFVLGMSVSTWS